LIKAPDRARGGFIPGKRKTICRTNFLEIQGAHLLVFSCATTRTMPARQWFPGGRRSTYCHEGNLLVALISDCAHALRIKDRLVIHQEPISVVAVPEQYFNEPPSILTPSHGMRSRIPGIEIAREIDRLRRWGGTIEIDRLDGSFGDKRFGAAIKHSGYNWQWVMWVMIVNALPQ
jgi:hypothetical protein